MAICLGPFQVTSGNFRQFSAISGNSGQLGGPKPKKKPVVLKERLRIAHLTKWGFGGVQKVYVENVYHSKR